MAEVALAIVSCELVCVPYSNIPKTQQHVRFVLKNSADV
mgnify:CR=1 FL=1|jgi:hypothetical protein